MLRPLLLNRFVCYYCANEKRQTPTGVLGARSNNAVVRGATERDDLLCRIAFRDVHCIRSDTTQTPSVVTSDVLTGESRGTKSPPSGAR